MRYHIISNYQSPFFVDIIEDNVIIYENETNKLLFDVTVKQIFIGKSPKNSYTTFHKGYGKKYNGNSILLNIRGLKYMFIGERIFSFTAKSKIMTFVSPLAKNLVPMSYAVDENENIYHLATDDPRMILNDDNNFSTDDDDVCADYYLIDEDDPAIKPLPKYKLQVNGYY